MFLCVVLSLCNCLSKLSSSKVQRAWIVLEEKKAQYQYVEIQPYHKPKELLDVNPKGLVPVDPISGQELISGNFEGWILSI